MKGLGFVDCCFDDFVWFVWWFVFGQCVDVFYVVFDLVLDGVLLIEEGGVVEVDEELVVG